MAKVLITDKIDQSVVDQVKNSTVVFDYQPEITPENLIKIISNYDGLIVRGRTKVTKEIIDMGIILKVIGRAGSGLDNVDTSAAKKQRITVVNAPEGNTNAVVELTLTLMLTLLRNLAAAYSSMGQGLWLKKELVGSELAGKTIGVVGYGHIGKKVAELVKKFGARPLFYSRTSKNSSLENIFKNSDIISLHLPLTPETKNLVGSKLLSLMKSTAFLINTGRGKTVDEEVLYQLLSRKKIGGAALDVYWQEPLLPDSRWRKLPNVILTPHLGASTKEALTRATEIVVNKVINILDKK
jgi:D-3-phosphoglycerate dehydrogenase